jgi:hypothetical protein
MGQKKSPELKDRRCDNVLPGQDYCESQGVVHNGGMKISKGKLTKLGDIPAPVPLHLLRTLQQVTWN